jgi:hypothetical protein
MIELGKGGLRIPDTYLPRNEGSTISDFSGMRNTDQLKQTREVSRQIPSILVAQHENRCPAEADGEVILR